MQRGVHFPPAGMQASTDRIPRHAMRAEALGLSDVWVAAMTRRVWQGTLALMLSMRHPLPLAKERGTLRELSAGRPILEGVSRIAGG